MRDTILSQFWFPRWDGVCSSVPSTAEAVSCTSKISQFEQLKRGAIGFLTFWVRRKLRKQEEKKSPKFNFPSPMATVPSVGCARSVALEVCRDTGGQRKFACCCHEVDEYADRSDMAPFMTRLPLYKWPSRSAPCMVGRISRETTP